MKLTSNVTEVIGRLRRLQEGIPVAVGKALGVTEWSKSLYRDAEFALWSVFKQEPDEGKRAVYERLGKRLMATFAAQKTSSEGGGSITFMLGPFIGVQAAAESAGANLEEAIAANLGQVTKTGRVKKFAGLEPSQEEKIEAAREAVADWVRVEKHWETGPGGRDAGRSEEQVIERIQEILGLNAPPFNQERTPAMVLAGSSLRGAIEKWLAGEGENPPTTPKGSGGKALAVDPQMAQDWLLRVLAVWRAKVRSRLKYLVRLEVARLKDRVKTELI